MMMVRDQPRVGGAGDDEKEFEMMSAQPNPTISRKPQINVVAQYLLTLAAVIGCYSLYLQFAVPMIEGLPNELNRRQINPLPGIPFSGADKSQLVPLLPDDAWELSGCKTLLTSSGTLLFKDIEQLEDGTLQVLPFTLISGLDQEPDSESETPARPPMVLRCLKGANVKFDKPMRDVFNGGSKIESAQLTGQVRIFRPSSDPAENDSLEILTSNIQIDKKRIYTLDDVNFWFGANHGSGRNLLIDLAHDTAGSEAIKDFSNIKGVRRLELAFLDKLRVEPTDASNQLEIVDINNGSSDAGNTDRVGGKMFSNNQSPLEITCKGPFVFEFQSMTASFEDQVVAQQIDAFHDNIKCDKLLLTFAGDLDPDSVTEATPANQGGQVQEESEFKLKNFVALGKPAVVTSRSRSAKVTAEYLQFDVESSRIEARGNPAGNELVTLVSPEYQMVTRQLSYVIPEDNSLGPIEANGPGRLLRVASDDQDELFATWTKSLTSHNDPSQVRRQHVILDGETKIRISNETRVDAERVELQVWKSLTQQPLPDGTIKKTWQYQPAKVIASGNVKIASAKLEGTSDQLTATWPVPPRAMSGYQPQVTPTSDLHRLGYRGVLQQPFTGSQRPAQTYTRFQEIMPNQQTGNPSNTGQAKIKSVTPAQKPSKKMIFHGRKVDVRLFLKNQKSALRDLIVIGDVSITEKPILDLDARVDPQSHPLVITGQRMRLIPQDDENYRALVSGSKKQLAKISAPDLELEGENINLDQAANKLWVEGVGSMQHRASKPKKDTGRSSPTQTFGQNFKPEQLSVTWQGGMIFDGAKIYFEKGVQMSTEQVAKNNRRSIIQASSEGISVELKRPINFQNLAEGQDADNLEVREMVLVDRVSPDKQVFQLAAHSNGGDPTQNGGAVVLVNQTRDDFGQLVEQQRFTAPHVTIDADSGSLQAKGPGTIATHRLVESDSKGSADPFRRMAQVGSQDGISFVQINFDRDLNIDSKQRQMIVTGNIRTLYAPVRDWNMTLNPDANPGVQTGGVYLTCQRLQLAQWNSRDSSKPTNEMIATGNAHIRNDRFDATADRVAYNQSTDMLLIEGTPRSDANLRFKQTANDKNPTHLIAEKIRFRIKDQWTAVQGVKGLNASRK